MNAKIVLINDYDCSGCDRFTREGKPFFTALIVNGEMFCPFCALIKIKNNEVVFENEKEIVNDDKKFEVNKNQFFSSYERVNK